MASDKCSAPSFAYCALAVAKLIQRFLLVCSVLFALSRSQMNGTAQLTSVTHDTLHTVSLAFTEDLNICHYDILMELPLGSLSSNINLL